jgi:predicted methyltransferase
MTTEQEYYWFRNTTDSTIIINDLSRPASIAPREVSRSFSADEVRQSSDLRRFFHLGILTQEEDIEESFPPLKKSGKTNPLSRTPEFNPPLRRVVPEGVDVQDLGERGASTVASQGTEFVNPKFNIGDFVYIKGPSNMSGKISGRRGTDGRWQIKLSDGRVAYAVEDAMLTVDQYAVSQPTEAQRTTLKASEVLKRGLVTPAQQKNFDVKNNSRMHADDVIRNRTSLPASQMQGRPSRPEVDTPVSGRRFTTDEVKSRPPVHGGVEIVMDGQLVNSETLVSEKLHRAVATSDVPEVEIDESSIVMNGSKANPLGGEEITTGEMVSSAIKHTAREMSQTEKKRLWNKNYQKKLKAQKEGAKQAEKPTASKAAPKFVVDFLAKSLNEQKMFVVKENDVEKLAVMAEHIPHELPVHKMIEQRIAQLQIV